MDIHEKARLLDTAILNELKIIIETVLVDRLRILELFQKYEWKTPPEMLDTSLSDREWLGYLKGLHEDVQIWASAEMEAGMKAYQAGDFMEIDVESFEAKVAEQKKIDENSLDH